MLFSLSGCSLAATRFDFPGPSSGSRRRDGIFFTLSTLSLFAALALGPVSLVAPIAGSYPVLAMFFAVAQGARPSLLQWLAVAGVLTGVVLVSRSGETYEQSGYIPPGKSRRPLSRFPCARASAPPSQQPKLAGKPRPWSLARSPPYGLRRIFGLITIGAIYLMQRSRGELPARWLPLLGLMGGLDVAAFAAILAAGNLPDPAFATVVSSAFSAVTVILARAILKEPISPIQLLGMILIFGGVAGLAGL